MSLPQYLLAVENGYNTLISSLDASFISGSIPVSVTPVDVSGSISGKITYTQPFTGEGYKRVVIYLTSLLGTATFTFPTAFANEPGIVASSLLLPEIVTSLDATSITITGTTSTGYIYLEGF